MAITKKSNGNRCLQECEESLSLFTAGEIVKVVVIMKNQWGIFWKQYKTELLYDPVVSFHGDIPPQRYKLAASLFTIAMIMN